MLLRSSGTSARARASVGLRPSPPLLPSLTAGGAAAAPAWTPVASLAPASDLSLSVDRDGKALVLATLGTETGSSVADYVHPVSSAGWQAEPSD